MQFTGMSDSGLYAETTLTLASSKPMVRDVEFYVDLTRHFLHLELRPVMVQFVVVRPAGLIGHQ
jgi:hypothetical protein